MSQPVFNAPESAAPRLPQPEPHPVPHGTPQSGATAPNATAAPPRPSTAPPRVDRLPPWKVLLHNDDVNDMVHVIDTIVMLGVANRQQAILRMLEAHEAGSALLMTTHRERAELISEQFTSRGLVVTIEPA